MKIEPFEIPQSAKAHQHRKESASKLNQIVGIATSSKCKPYSNPVLVTILQVSIRLVRWWMGQQLTKLIDSG